MQEIFWGSGEQEYSLIKDVVSLLQVDPHYDPVLVLISSAQKQLGEQKNQLLFTRMLLLCASHQLIQLPNESSVHKDALALMLYFIAFTYTYFKPFEYEGFTSPKFDGAELNYSSKRKTEQRTYSSQFVWGQLIGWFKQTVANPQASLSQDRRGTLSYPSLLASFEKGDKYYPFS